MKPPSLTLGIEEEYQIIDPETRELRSYITEILNGDQMLLGEIKPEEAVDNMMKGLDKAVKG